MMEQAHRPRSCMSQTFQLQHLIYIPNIIGYFRLWLIFYSLTESIPPVNFLAAVGLSFFLDLFDGPVARYLDQCSVLGAILDIVCDNFGRSTMWIQAAAIRPEFNPVAAALIALEWSTLLATQTQAYLEGNRHWKKRAEVEMPALIRQYFHRNFRNPLGATGMLGLFILPVHIYVETQIPWIADFFGPLVWSILFVWFVAGRAITAGIELYFVFGFANFLAENETGRSRLSRACMLLASFYIWVLAALVVASPVLALQQQLVMTE